MLTELPYRSDSAALFERIAHWPWAVFLDSGRPRISSGRYDIFTADPYMTLATHGEQTEIHEPTGHRVSTADPFDLVRECLGDRTDEHAFLPFSGGAIGWFAYDLGRRIERLPELAVDAEDLPEMAIGIYDWAVVVDHQSQRSWLVGQGRDSRTRRRWWQLLDLFCRNKRTGNAPARQAFRVTGPVQSNLSRDDYAEGFEQIKRYIRDGDCYQVNFAQRFSATAEGDAWSAYEGLRALNPAPFAAYMNTPFGQALSSSPERLLQLRGGCVETKPIKGTRPRGDTPEGDSEMARELAGSRKDQAENLMIVDLLRNDIGRVCKPGSVRVPNLFAIESYATVHHMVSTITGELTEGEDALSLMRSCFPGGSITGAPKIRAMEIIESLEPHRRGLYCGSIGYMGFDGRMDSNITIRTMVYNHGEIRCWAGGGIVYDSEMESEYQETYHKAEAMLRLLTQEVRAHVGA